MVALYLSYLDEYIFKKNIIKGVITIGSPNTGSPLANPDNREIITDEIISILVKILIKNQNMQLNIIKKLQEQINFENVIETLTFLINITPESEKIYPILITAFKWLSGLNSNAPEAKAMSFIDLNITNIEDKPYSVISLINKNKLKNTIIGSIINGNNKSTDMLNSLLGLFSLLIPNDINKIFTDSYKKVFMKENSIVTDQFILKKMTEYKNGDGKIPPECHDFISPSVYQKIENDGTNFLGNVFNPEVNHLTGTQKFFLYGNLIPLRAMLRDMRTKLKTQGVIK